MSVAVIGVVADDVHTVHLAVMAAGERAHAFEGARPASPSWCSHVPADGPPVLREVAHEPRLGQLKITTAPDVQCYVETVVRGSAGQEVARVGVVGHAPHATLNERDLGVLEGLAAVAAEHFEARQTGGACDLAGRERSRCVAEPGRHRDVPAQGRRAGLAPAVSPDRRTGGA